MTPRTTFSLLLLGLTLVGAGMVAIDTYFDHLAFERLKRYVDHALAQHRLESPVIVLPVASVGQDCPPLCVADNRAPVLSFQNLVPLEEGDYVLDAPPTYDSLFHFEQWLRGQ